ALRSVEPTRSQKRTVSWRRSPCPDSTASCRGAAGAPESSRAPQPKQKRAPVRTPRPQEGQRAASGAPQLSQKRRPASFSAPQAGQCGESGVPHAPQKRAPGRTALPQLGQVTATSRAESSPGRGSIPLEAGRSSPPAALTRPARGGARG